jgi:hypothetical protein
MPSGPDAANVFGKADYLFAVESRETARIQGKHGLAGHMLCDWIEIDCIRCAESSEAEVAK